MKKIFIYFALALFISSCSKPQTLVGGPCEGCEAVFEYGDKNLTPVDTLPGFDDGGTKIKISGTVFKNDGLSPAEDVIIYIYQTDTTGRYELKGNETGWGKRHGYMRGWIKTNADGRYAFYTIKAGNYPRSSTPAHIHITILEPDGKYYWINDFLFSDDPFLTPKDISAANPRGGNNGILTLKEENGLLTGERNIILGKNIEGY
jgi:protocatechuate 3,4-dioxygenase, beta subunit